MIGEKPVDLFKAMIVSGNGDVQELVVLSEFDADGDIERIGRTTEFCQVVLVRHIFVAYAQHFQVGCGIIDLRDNKLPYATTLCLIKELLNWQSTVFETEAGVTVEKHWSGG
jgi:hypothetical protein